MAKLLHIESSPCKNRSQTDAVARAVLDAYLTLHPDDAVNAWDLRSADEPLVEFDGVAIAAKYAVCDPGSVHTSDEPETRAAITVDDQGLSDAAANEEKAKTELARLRQRSDVA